MDWEREEQEMDKKLLGGSAMSMLNPETAIHQTGSPEITWHTGKWNLKINDKGQVLFLAQKEPRGKKWKRL